MLNYASVINEEKSYSGLQMKEIKPVMKLIIRGKEFLSAIGKSLNLLCLDLVIKVKNCQLFGLVR